MFGKSKAVKVGNIIIGGDAPVTVQSMTNTDAHDFGIYAPSGERAGASRM